MSVDRVYEEVMAMSEQELVAELAKEGETLESNARKMRLIFERAKAQVAMEKFIKAWLKCPTDTRPSVAALCAQLEREARGFLDAELQHS